MTINHNTLYRFCNDNKYFTCGTNEQYDKLFERNRKNASTTELGIIIWICSDKNFSRREIISKLHTLWREELENDRC